MKRTYSYPDMFQINFWCMNLYKVYFKDQTVLEKFYLYQIVITIKITITNKVDKKFIFTVVQQYWFFSHLTDGIRIKIDFDSDATEEASRALSSRYNENVYVESAK